MADAEAGDIFKNYNPEGGMGGLFAPAYIKGYEPSEKALSSWNAQNNNMTSAMIEQTRMPNAWVDPTAGQSSFGMGMDRYGAGRIPNNLQFNPQGSVDPEALRVAAQGGKYDMAGRRDAIAQRVQANSAAEGAYNKSRANPWSMYGAGRGGMLPIGFNTMSPLEIEQSGYTSSFF